MNHDFKSIFSQPSMGMMNQAPAPITRPPMQRAQNGWTPQMELAQPPMTINDHIAYLQHLGLIPRENFRHSPGVNPYTQSE